MQTRPSREHVMSFHPARRSVGAPVQTTALVGAALVGAVVWLGAPATAHAEGSADLVPVDETLPETEVFVDTLADTEVIVYTGDIPVDMYGPSGVFLATIDPGTSIPVIDYEGQGTYRFDWPVTLENWDFEVPGRVGGRVWSPDWRFNAGSFREDDALNRSFYAVVDGGADGRVAIVEMLAEGFAGYVFKLGANSRGVRGSSGFSIPFAGQEFIGEFPVYLEPPEDFVSNPVAAGITNVELTYEAGEECEILVPEELEATLTFESDARGVWHLICDLDMDGVFDLTDPDDLHLLGPAEIGLNEFQWQGLAQQQQVIPAGTYECIVRVTVGEFHYVGYDIETIFPGFRLFEYISTVERRGLPMFWNDAAVQAADVQMPSGDFSVETSGPDGVSSGNYTDVTDPLTNARGWGDFRGASKGNEAFLDTYTWADAEDSAVFTVNVADGAADTDGDTLLDVEEECIWGTDPLNPDTDEDGLRDDVEVGPSPTDPLDPDSDDDCLLDGEEAPPDGRLVPPGDWDADGDGLPNPLDDDDDGDGIPTEVEICDNEDYPDGDDIPNHLDGDSDGDRFSDLLEGTGDIDGDGRPDFLDVDTVGNSLINPDGWFAGGCNSSGLGTSLLLGLGGVLALRRRRED